MLNWFSGERAPQRARDYSKRPLRLGPILQNWPEPKLQLDGFVSATDLVAESHHRVANCLTILIGMVHMQAVSVEKRAEPFSNAEVRLLLEGVAARIATIGQLNRTLSYSGGDGAINLQPYLRDVTNSLVTALSCPERQVRIVHTGSGCMIQMRQAQPIALIVSEIFINAMKYAHPAGTPLVMAVDCNAGSDGRLVLTVSDDGVGLPEPFEAGQGHGMGFKVMHSVAAQIGGDLQVCSSRLGLSFRLSFIAGAAAAQS